MMPGWLIYKDEHGGDAVVRAESVEALEKHLQPRDNPGLDIFGTRIILKHGWVYSAESLEDLKAKLLKALND